MRRGTTGRNAVYPCPGFDSSANAKFSLCFFQKAADRSPISYSICAEPRLNQSLRGTLTLTVQVSDDLKDLHTGEIAPVFHRPIAPQAVSGCDRTDQIWIKSVEPILR